MEGLLHMSEILHISQRLFTFGRDSSRQRFFTYHREVYISISVSMAPASLPMGTG
jgi:hypothetical protein